MTSKILITICARGGSKGILKKNIQSVNGKPLIAYTIIFAFRLVKEIKGDIILSSEDSEIINIARQYGLKTEYKRPIRLATDSAGKLDVLHDALTYMEKKTKIIYDYLIDLDVTSPLRTTDDIKDAFELLKLDKNAENIFSVNNPVHNPYFDIVERKENGYFDLVKNKGDFFSRQTSPEVYELNASFYIFKRKYFLSNNKTQIGSKSLVFKMNHLCFEIDSQSELDYLSYLIEKI